MAVHVFELPGDCLFCTEDDEDAGDALLLRPTYDRIAASSPIASLRARSRLGRLLSAHVLAMESAMSASPPIDPW